MRAGLATLALVAVVLGTAGVATRLVERRVATLTPGGVAIGALEYNPLSGRLVLDGVRAHDAVGRSPPLFRGHGSSSPATSASSKACCVRTPAGTRSAS